MSLDALDRLERATTNLHTAAFHHGSFRPKTHDGSLRVPYTHTPSPQGKDHAAARDAHETAMSDLRASIVRDQRYIEMLEEAIINVCRNNDVAEHMIAGCKRRAEQS